MAPGASTIKGVPYSPSAVRMNLPMTVADLPDPRQPAQDAYYDIATAQQVDGGPYNGIVRRVSVRGSGTFDLYSGQGQGFRLSAGPRYHMQYSPTEDGPGAASSSIAMMRLPAGAISLRDGYERLAPVGMAGYDTFVADRLKVGVEGGMMLGRASGLYAMSSVPNGVQESRTETNPVADFTMTYLF